MKRFFVILVLLFIFGLYGCNNQKSVVKKYYVLETPKDTTVIDTTSTEYIDEFCEVGKVNIYPAFSTRRIANRSRSHEITYYSSHEWAVRPTDILTNMLVDYMNAKGLFKSIAPRYWEVSPKYKIETTIYQLEVVKQNNDLAAHLHIEFRLVNNESKKTVTRYQADLTNPLEERKINLFASAISKMYYSAINDFSARINQVFEKKDNDQ
jgi:ABC-type uncharacterized transport system auxiliary subunit